MDSLRGLWRGKTKPKSECEAFNSVWVEGNLIQVRDSYYIHPLANSVNVQNELGRLVVMHEVDPSTLGECTGLTDKNGVKIFEGDIVKTKKYGKIVEHSNVNDYDIFVVTYEPCMFRLINKTRGFNLVDDGYSKLEVIGNIHDTPELLK